MEFTAADFGALRGWIGGKPISRGEELTGVRIVGVLLVGVRIAGVVLVGVRATGVLLSDDVQVVVCWSVSLDSVIISDRANIRDGEWMLELVVDGDVEVF